LLNKIDLNPFTKEDMDKLLYTFIQKGYDCMAISALTGDGIGNLKELLNKIFGFESFKGNQEIIIKLKETL